MNGNGLFSQILVLSENSAIVGRCRKRNDNLTAARMNISYFDFTSFYMRSLIPILE